MTNIKDEFRLYFIQTQFKVLKVRVYKNNAGIYDRLGINHREATKKEFNKFFQGQIQVAEEPGEKEVKIEEKPKVIKKRKPRKKKIENIEQQKSMGDGESIS